MSNVLNSNIKGTKINLPNLIKSKSRIDVSNKY